MLFRRVSEVDAVSVGRSYWIPMGNSKNNGKKTLSTLFVELTPAGRS